MSKHDSERIFEGFYSYLALSFNLVTDRPSSLAREIQTYFNTIIHNTQVGLFPQYPGLIPLQIVSPKESLWVYIKVIC